MANLQEVPVVDVQADNIQELWPTLLLAVRTSAFIAIDTELSGLGNRKKLNAKDLDERYSALAHIASTRSIISVGLSCFKHEKSADLNSQSMDSGSSNKEKMPVLKFVCQTFNFLTLSSEEYIVEPRSLRFLVNHNFDFNRQYAKGIPYYRGPDQEKSKDRQWMRELLQEITTHKIPVVFHNAFIDLGFLYQSFHTTLPTNIGSMLADLTEIFTGGVFDTKYIAEFQARYPASYLEYVFRKCQRDNQELFSRGRESISIRMLKYPSSCTYITYLPCNILTSTNTDTELCMTYAGHGWCAAGINCPKSHDINKILDADEKHISGKRKRRKRKANEENTLEDTNTTKDEMNSTSVAMETEKLEEDSNTLSNIDTVKQDDSESADLPIIDNDLVLGEQCPVINGEESMAVCIEQKEPNLKMCGGKSEPNQQNRSRTEGHRAGFDSFMTGFIFAYFIQKHGKRDTTDLPIMTDFENKVTLSGKEIPLRIIQSTFVKTSKEHRLKMDKIQSNVT